MVCRYTHWCKNGCGKTVVYLFKPKAKQAYICEECGRKHSVEEVKNENYIRRRKLKI